MRETLKSLSIFSAMLLLLLLISSGCDVNIPGCGKRSLPFFKKVVPPPAAPINTAPLTTPVPATSLATPPALSPVASTANPTVSSAPEKSIEMSVSAKPTKGPSATPTATPTPLEVERIAFTTVEKGKPALYSMNTDGTDRVRLTKPGTGSYYPLWSPNGKLLAFFSDMEEGKINLFMVPKGGTKFQQLTFYSDFTFSNPKSLKPPFSWSPRSDEIAYSYKNEVWKVQVASAVQQTLVTLDPSYLTTSLEWAPHRDTKYVAFLVKRGLQFYSLSLVNPRLLDQLTLTETDRAISDISWSPNAKTVAYILDKNKVYTASAETSIPKRILSNACTELGPILSYSPVETSTTLLLLAKKSPLEAYRIAMIDKESGGTDTGSLKYLTDPGVDNFIWSPDGSKIAFTQSGELWVMDTSGANKKRIAAIGVLSPNWSKK